MKILLNIQDIGELMYFNMILIILLFIISLYFIFKEIPETDKNRFKKEENLIYYPEKRNPLEQDE